MTCCPRPAMKDSWLASTMPCVSLLDPSPHWGRADVEVCVKIILCINVYPETLGYYYYVDACTGISCGLCSLLYQLKFCL